jgi:AraC-like DNA-binding protein
MSDLRGWPICLTSKPTISTMGIGIHGSLPVERYQVTGWCVHLYRYDGELILDDVSYAIAQRSAGTIPPGLKQEYRFGGPGSQHLYAHFTVPRAPRSSYVSIGAMQDLGNDFPRIYGEFEHAVAVFSSRPSRAEARLWDILWELAERTPSVAAGPRRHPALEKAIERIELGLAHSIRVSDLAREVGISQTHLRRLFEEDRGQSVRTYIRSRRMERVRQLLQNSTLSIKAIAQEVGIPDLQHFNKVVRRELGAAPTRLRRR